MLTEELKFDYVIRFRGNIAVTATDGEVRSAAFPAQASPVRPNRKDYEKPNSNRREEREERPTNLPSTPSRS